jgi:LuxR family quorum sensing-dependent transcriptional regulator
MLTLTAQDKRVLELLAEGARDKEIAAELGVTTRGALRRVELARTKLGASTRAHAVALFLRGTSPCAG